MKKIEKLKLHSLGRQTLEKEQQNAIRGGSCTCICVGIPCMCECLYYNLGGTNTTDNSGTNVDVNGDNGVYDTSSGHHN